MFEVSDVPVVVTCAVPVMLVEPFKPSMYMVPNGCESPPAPKVSS